MLSVGHGCVYKSDRKAEASKLFMLLHVIVLCFGSELFLFDSLRVKQTG